ncbi:MAG: hypothetical protein AAGL10_02235 [Pseudomonadota bacterium]
MFRAIAFWCLSAFLLLGAPNSVAFAQTPVVAHLDAPFVHEGSGITVPAAVDRFDRVSVTDFSEEQLNIAAQYRDANNDTVITLFIYRAAGPNISI